MMMSQDCHLLSEVTEQPLEQWCLRCDLMYGEVLPNRSLSSDFDRLPRMQSVTYYKLDSRGSTEQSNGSASKCFGASALGPIYFIQEII